MFYCFYPKYPPARKRRHRQGVFRASAPGHKKLIQTPADLDAALRKAGVGDVAAREMRIRYGIPIDSEAPLDAKGALGASDDVQRQVAAELAARTHNAKVGMAERGLTMA